MLSKENILVSSKENNEPSWLTDLRTSSFEKMHKLSYPKMQRFSYQDWPLIAKEDFKWQNQPDFFIKKRIMIFLTIRESSYAIFLQQ